jgi:hypothetical protein
MSCIAAAAMPFLAASLATAVWAASEQRMPEEDAAQAGPEQTSPEQEAERRRAPEQGASEQSAGKEQPPEQAASVSAPPNQIAPYTPPMQGVYSVWQGNGDIVQVGVNEAMIVGTFTGVVFVITENTPSDVGIVTCPTILRVDLTRRTQIGNGGCAFTGYDGAQTYGTWECRGRILEGCRGILRLNGGTGRFENTRAESSMMLHGRVWDFTEKPNYVLSEHVLGVASWPDLTVLGPVTAARR